MNKVILRYSDFISENKNIDLKEGLIYLKDEYNRLKLKGLTEEQINENIFTSLFDKLGKSVTDIIKNYIVDWVVEQLGIETHNDEGKPTFFYQVIRNIVESMSWKDVGKYFGKDSCEHWAKAIINGIIETFEEKGFELFLSVLGIKANMEIGFGNNILRLLRETLTDTINNTKFINGLEKIIYNKICGFNIKDVLFNRIKSKDKEIIANKLDDAEKKFPNVLPQAMKTGLYNSVASNISKKN